MRTDKKQKKLRPFTPKRQKINVEYNEKAAMFREANPVCKINSPVCTRFTQGVHHVKGKSTIGLLLDENFWKPACNACNGYIEDNSAWAKENGHKVPNYK